ncbi:hypothetical protein EW026_g6385 [Hermanssonia centrifuga]|uniref:Uncharacterized protein n=1 Tax=Hermanssonia centrifuga TaxID=98765 RepID=A0A4V3X9R8_9APHY|nr:hypothetical protein EW026_g6385 [Hermanssonia centrifuga]
MRFQTILGYGMGLAAFLQIAAASPLDEPEVLAVASFPEENAFGHVVNGEKNNVFLAVENKSDRNITLQSIAGSIHHPETNALVKNTTALTYKVPLLGGAKIQLPYSFYSEFKPGDWRLNIWIDHTAEGEKYRVQAYDSIITVVEPEVSIFDFKMLSTYAIVIALLGAIGYYTYLSFAPQPKKRKTPAVSAPVGPVTATGAGGYQEEWIPEHHLKKPKARKTKSTTLTSGDETSGAELSATEGKRRKNKK